MMNNAFVQDEALHIAQELEQNKNLSEDQRVAQAYLAVYQRQPSAEEVKRAKKFIKSEEGLLASAAPDEIVARTSTLKPETESLQRSARSIKASPRSRQPPSQLWQSSWRPPLL